MLDLIYIVLFIVLSPWWMFMLLTRPAFRAGIVARMRPRKDTNTRQPLIWLHASSAGEVGLLRSLIAALESGSVEHGTVVSAFAISGYTAAKKLFPQATVIYFPIDFSPVIRWFLRVFRPGLIILVESELWPNFITTAAKSDIPVCLLNGRMSEKSFRMHRRIKLIPGALKSLSLCAVQTEEDADRFRELGVPTSRVHVTGNMKYDIGEIGDSAKIARKLRGRYEIASDVPIIVGGSLHSGEEEALAWAYQQLLDSGRTARMIMVPRYPADAPTVAEVLRLYGFVPVLKSELDDAATALSSDSRHVLLVDTMGDLKQFYALSNIAFVGGSLHYRGDNKGGHNLMEPAMCGIAVMFGPYNYSFRETAEALTAENAGVLVRSRDDILASLRSLLDDAATTTDMGGRARRVILKNRGATARNYALLQSYLHAVLTEA